MSSKIQSIIQHPRFRIISLLVILAGISFPFMRDYLGPDFSADHVWLLLIPLIVYVQTPGQTSLRYSWIALAGLIGYLVIGAHVFAYFAVCCTAFLILETHLGKLNELAAVSVILIIPAVKYVFDIFGFPIRLKLTQFAAILLNLFGGQAEADGNFILVNGSEYSVDAVCMGLNMVVTGLIIGLLLIVYQEKRNKQILPRIPIIVFLMMVFGLVMLANLLRIVLLVITDFPPETAGHEIIGLLSLILCVIIPAWFLIGKIMARFALSNEKTKASPKTISNVWKYGTILSLTLILIWVRFDIQSQKANIQNPEYDKIVLPGFTKETLDLNIMRFTSDQALIYLKPGNGAFRRGHHPSMCWAGSGYEITREEIIEIGDQEIIMAQLIGDNQRLYTAWWYDNGNHITVDQMDWRWRVFKGEGNFWMVNVSAPNPERLMVEIGLLLDNTELILRE